MFYFPKHPTIGYLDEKEINKEPVSDCFLIWHMLKLGDTMILPQIQKRVIEYYDQHPDTFRDYYATTEFVNWGLRVLEDYGYAGHHENFWDAQRLAWEEKERVHKANS